MADFGEPIPGAVPKDFVVLTKPTSVKPETTEATETPEANVIAHYPFYENVPDYEYNKKRFDYMDSEELMIQTDNFMRRVADIYRGGSKIDAIFFLDKSARPLAYMFSQLFREYIKDEAVNPPQILFLNVGQEITLPDDSRDFTREIGFSGNPSSVQETYGKWIKPNSHLLVVDEYSSTGRSLNNAKSILDNAFESQNVEVHPVVAYTKVPKWYNRPDYLGVRDRTVEDYLEYARKQADKELETSYADIKPDRYGRLSTKDVPSEVQLKRLEIQRKVLHGNVGDIPTAVKKSDSQIPKAREELKRMCEQIVKKHAQEPVITK